MRLGLPGLSRKAAASSARSGGSERAYFERLDSGTVLVSGLRWVVPLQGEGATIAGLRRMGKTHNASLYVQVNSARSRSEYFAFLPGRPPKGATRVASLAVWFAHSTAEAAAAEGTVLYMRPAAGGRVALALAVHGEPDPDVDTVVEPEEAVRIAEEVRQQNLNARVVLDARFGDALPTWAAPLADIAVLFDPLRDAAPPAALLQPLPRVRRSPVGQALLLLFAVGLGGYFAYSEVYEPWQKARRPPPPPPVPPEQLYLSSRDQALKRAAPHVAPRAGVRAIQGSLAEVPLERGGFVLTRAKCDLSAGAGTCALSWKERGGTYERFTEADRSNTIGARFAADLQLRGQLAVAAPDKAIDVNTLPREQDFLLQWGSTWQEINRVAALAATKASFTPAVLQGTYNGTLGEKLPGRVLGGTWQLELPLGLIYLLEDLSSAMTLKTLEIKSAADPGAARIVATGNYYVR
jgi:hypothetical protein